MELYPKPPSTLNDPGDAWPGNIDEKMLLDEQVTSRTIAAGAVTTAKLDDGAVTTAKLDDGAVTKDKTNITFTNTSSPDMVAGTTLSLEDFLYNLAHQVKSLHGKTAWTDQPTLSITQINTLLQGLFSTDNLMANQFLGTSSSGLKTMLQQQIDALQLSVNNIGTILNIHLAAILDTANDTALTMCEM